MFKKITVAYNESPQAARAFAQAMYLAKALGSELSAVTVRDDLPSYTAFAAAADPSLPHELVEEQQAHSDRLHSEARDAALREGLKLETRLLDAESVDAIIRFLRDYKTDLLVIGLHRHARISRLWSKVYEVALDAPCSVLGVH